MLTMFAMTGVACVACVDSSRRGVVCRTADMGWQEFTAAVVPAVDHLLPDGIEGDPRFVVVHGGAAGDVVHIGMMDAGERRELTPDARRAQGRDQLADFDGACFHTDPLRVIANTSKLRICMRFAASHSILDADCCFDHDGKKLGVRAA